MPDTFKDYLERNIKKVVTKFTDMIQDVTPFIGTEAEWNALSAVEQAKYKLVCITDDVPDSINRSYVGMVIESTTFDTMAKVINFYGGTTWIQHDGYFLRGATSNVSSNSATTDGGEDTVTLTVNQIPSHTHQLNRQQWYTNDVQLDNTYSGIYSWKTNSGGDTSSIYQDASEGTSIKNTGGGLAHNNIPAYKNVYIWERTV